MKAILISLMLVIASALSISAQETVVLNKDLDSFTSVSLSGKLTFRLRNSSNYSVRIVSDKRIAEYVTPIVKNGVFSILLDEKKYSPELKKELKAKGAVEPVLEIEVFAPRINNITVKDKAILVETDEIEVDNFKLDVSGSANVNKLSVSCVSADMSFSNSSTSNLSVKVNSKLNVSVSNSASVNLAQKGGNGIFEVKGSSVLNLASEVLDLDIEASGSSDSHISGTASVLSVESSGTSKIDAEALEAMEGNFEMAGNNECNVNVEERMKVTLTNGATLTFKRTPLIDVERIINSTLIKADDPKRKM